MLITDQYRQELASLHSKRKTFGTSSHRYIDYIKEIIKERDIKTVLDYGCGKGELKASIDIGVQEYDPGIEGKNELPTPCDLVVCTHVLEHVEPECLDEVLHHLESMTIDTCFIVIPNKPAKKFLTDGRNAHLTIRGREYWGPKLLGLFPIVDSHYDAKEQETIAICYQR